MYLPHAIKGRAGKLLVGLTLFLFLAPSSLKALDDATMLSQKLEELERRETELEKKETRLRELELTLNEKIRQYEEYRAKAEAYLKEINVIQDEDLVHLIKTYEAMPPEGAAERISKLETSLAVRVLRGMKTRTSGKVMAQIAPTRAATLSKLMVSR